MEPSTHRKLFRPSSAPGKEKCGHFEPTISTSPNAVRGTEIHAHLCEAIPRMFTEEKIDPSTVTTPYLRYALSILYQSGVKNITAAERLVTLNDKDGRFVTEGTVDLFGLNEDLELMVYDWKTGQERDYSAQVVLYTLALMQENGWNKAWVHEVFVDQERTYRTAITRELAEERIFKIVENVRNPREHTMNKHCDWCDLQHDCPAWLWERKKMNGIFPMKFTNARSFEDRLAIIKEDPVLLSQFMITWKRMKRHVEKTGIETYALEQMKNGTKLDGLKLAMSSHGTQYIQLE
jgi:hypothetical protein